MARFQFNVRTLVAGCTAHAVVSQRTLGALELAGADEPPQGPGWFDSSWELVRGLEVHEELSFDVRRHDGLRSCLRVEPDQPVQAAPASRRAPPDAQHDAFSAFGIEGLELM
ncbi:MAG: hypothetical protein KGI87_16645 [Burkholderiales bacterium]|nr:hypothetical protein [Burkholderiales bacterium]